MMHDIKTKFHLTNITEVVKNSLCIVNIETIFLNCIPHSIIEKVHLDYILDQKAHEFKGFYFCCFEFRWHNAEKTP